MFRAILYAGLILSLGAAPALAEKGWTATLGGGFVLAEDADVESSTNPASIEFDAGVGVFAAIGYDYDPVRAEIEFSYRSFDVDLISESGSAGEVNQSTSGDVDIAGLFLNGYFDLNLVDWVKPYVGVGVGGAYVNANDVKISGRTGTLDDTDFVPGGQLMVGLAVPVMDSMDIAAGYRVMLLGDVEGAITGGSKAGNKTVTHVILHNFEIALRYRF